eukprot:CAMPEP_0177437722 /NCGR_PEP_ID=MMETSP0369-20130122/2357_1 /TAXON_ID=447022 ORGANISM="Scrippsiella hangoei-like, Strain SHHI-4" /NCGR_SAMPLE_ID=MMETSP0369 /ASSEMBLY_ACC=CAM_ASM_000364 /LENGTH=717 /DNA_ID=CAMNT_0018909209 /DNA_START=3 /DNA_END=2157 /DNA_ORIENTATION=-
MGDVELHSLVRQTDDDQEVSHHASPLRSRARVALVVLASLGLLGSAPLLAARWQRAPEGTPDMAAALQEDAETKGKGTKAQTMELDRFNLQGKSVYLVMTDRFNRVGGYSANDTAACTDLTGWCNGTFAGITEQLPYIKGMGFDCIWVTPVVENPSVEDAPPPAHDEGGSGYGYHGYWAQNYYKTDPHYGSNDELKELVKAVHDIGMCFVLDIVMNHMGPIHSWAPLSVEKKIPFNKPEYYHQVDRGDLSWDEYTATYANWPNPAQSMGPGTLCKLNINSTTGQPDYTNGGNYCNNYVNVPPYDNRNYLGKDAAGPRDLMYCGAGNFDCPGYNQTLIWEGWFYDLGDLNHSHPFVVKKQLEWIEWVKEQFDIDAIRLDTSPYMPWTFLAKLQEAAHPVQIHGEVTTTNISFHASFQKYPTGDGGFKVLAGMENFPPFYMATPGFCGDPGQPSSPVATWDLRKLGQTMTEQTEGPYVTVDGLMNFVDNQDYTPVAKTCGSDESRIKNSLTWVFFCYGIPLWHPHRDVGHRAGEHGVQEFSLAVRLEHHHVAVPVHQDLELHQEESRRSLHEDRGGSCHGGHAHVQAQRPGQGGLDLHEQLEHHGEVGQGDLPRGPSCAVQMQWRLVEPRQEPPGPQEMLLGGCLHRSPCGNHLARQARRPQQRSVGVGAVEVQVPSELSSVTHSHTENQSWHLMASSVALALFGHTPSAVGRGSGTSF